jgi:inhibitor of KinA
MNGTGMNETIDEWQIKPAGDSAVLLQLPQQINLSTHQKVSHLASALDQAVIPGLLELVPAYCTVMVHYDPARQTYAGITTEIRKFLGTDLPSADSHQRIVEIPVVYGGEYGPDLADVAKLNGLAPEEVVQIHSQGKYSVYLMGFTPGFPYLGGLDPRIATPRLSSPRTQVPAGAVGIAGDQTGVYSIASPGGWRIIGRTPLRLFDLSRQEPFLLQPGDEVHFRPIDSLEAANDR